MLNKEIVVCGLKLRLSDKEPSTYLFEGFNFSMCILYAENKWYAYYICHKDGLNKVSVKNTLLDQCIQLFEKALYDFLSPPALLMPWYKKINKCEVLK